MAIERQSTTLPPAQPSYIFRGHSSQIHSVQFVRQNRRLLTGDADGCIVYWGLESKRPLAVWRAHDGAILGTAEWGPEKIITHGRDNALRIWQLRSSDESSLSTVLPAHGAAAHRQKPWLLHTLPVNTLNFCAFSMCHVSNMHRTDRAALDQGAAPLPRISDSILVAVPARDDKKIEVYQFPDEKLVSVIPRVESTDTGMVMAVKLIHHSLSNKTLVLAGYEGGFTAIHLLAYNPHSRPEEREKSIPEFARVIYLSRPHSQPILSLHASSDAKTYFTSSADAVIAAHRIPELSFVEDDKEPSASPSNSISAPPAEPAHTNTETASESLGFSKRVVPTPSSASSFSFAKQVVPVFNRNDAEPSGLSALLSSAAPPQPNTKTAPPASSRIELQPPARSVQTRHAGQQSLRVRSDGRLMATGGWDSRVRIYSTKTLKEMAVLKWHKDGVYAVDFSVVLDGTSASEQTHLAQIGAEDAKVMLREHGLGRLQRQREEQMQLKHWVAAGAKDGKISLWEVF